MKKQILTTAFLLVALTSWSQNATRDAAGNFHALGATSAAHDSTTAHTYTQADGSVLPVYRGRKGGVYVITGGKRHYLKTEAPVKK